MGIVIISDINANAESLRVLPEDYEELWILGDLLNLWSKPHRSD
jgi:hypothetical protein